MKKISHYVEEYIKENSFIEESLNRGIINVAALAEQFLPRLQKDFGKELTLTSVNMAIRRYGERNREKEANNWKNKKHIEDINIRNNLIAINFKKTSLAQKKIKEIYNLIEGENGDYITVTEGRNEIMIITNKKYEEEISDICGEVEFKIKVISLGAIQIKLKETAINEIGVFHKIIKEISWNHLNIVDIVSTYTELIIILKEDDLMRAFEILRKLES